MESLYTYPGEEMLCEAKRSRLLLVSHEATNSVLRKLTSTSIGRIRQPDMLHITPFSGLVAVASNRCQIVAIFGIDASYNFVLVNEFRLAGSTVKGLTSFVLKPLQPGTGKAEVEKVRCFLIVCAGTRQRPLRPGLAEYYSQVLAFTWPVQIDLWSGVSETEVQQNAPDGTTTISKVSLFV